jgi:hypothetical protein
MRTVRGELSRLSRSGEPEDEKAKHSLNRRHPTRRNYPTLAKGGRTWGTINILTYFNTWATSQKL